MGIYKKLGLLKYNREYISDDVYISLVQSLFNSSVDMGKCDDKRDINKDLDIKDNKIKENKETGIETDIKESDENSTNIDLALPFIWEVNPIKDVLPEMYVIKYHGINISDPSGEYLGINVLKDVFDYERLEDDISSGNTFKKVGSASVLVSMSGDIKRDIEIVESIYSDIIFNSIIEKQREVIKEEIVNNSDIKLKTTKTKKNG